MSTSTAAAVAAASAPAQPTGAHLGHTVLNIDSLRDLARKELVNVLDSVCHLSPFFFFLPSNSTDANNPRLELTDVK